MVNKKLTFGILAITAFIAGWLLLSYPTEVVVYGGSELITWYPMVERISVWQSGKEYAIDPKSPEYFKIGNILIPTLNKSNLQAACVFSEEEIQQIKSKNKVVELIFKESKNITIAQWIEPEDRDHIPTNESGYRILENVRVALFILEDNLGHGLKGNILIGQEIYGRIGYSCWAVIEEGGKEIDKTWIDLTEHFIKS